MHKYFILLSLSIGIIALILSSLAYQGSGGFITLSNAGENSLIKDSQGPNFILRGIQAGNGILVKRHENYLTIDNNSSGADVTLTNLGDNSLVADGIGPNLQMRGLSSGSGIAITSNNNNLIVTNTTTLNDSLASSGVSLITQNTGPDFLIRTILASTGIDVSTIDGDLVITNISPASDVLLSDAPSSLGTSLITNGTGPNLLIRAILASTGIDVSTAGGDLIITNSSPASDVSLSDSPGSSGASLITDGTGPDLFIRTIGASTGINVSILSGNIIITNTSPGSAVLLSDAASSSGTSLITDGAGPTLSIRTIVASTGINVSTAGGDLVITNTSLATSVTLSDAASSSGVTLITDGVGPTLSIRTVFAGPGIFVSAAGGDLVITNTSPGTSVSLNIAPSASGESLIYDGAGPNMQIRSILGGPGISTSSVLGDVVLTNLYGPRYSTYADITVTGTLAETDFSTTASSTGSLTFSPTLALGTVICFNLGFTSSSPSGDIITIRFKSNNVTLFSHSISFAGGASNLPVFITSYLTVQNNNARINSTAVYSSLASVTISVLAAFDRTITNTFSITCQWSSQLTSTATNTQLYVSL